MAGLFCLFTLFSTLVWSNRSSELPTISQLHFSFQVNVSRMHQVLKTRSRSRFLCWEESAICRKCYNEVKRNFRSRRLRFNTSSSPLVILGSGFCIRTLFVLICLGCSGTQYDPKYWCHQQKVKADLIGKHQGRSLIYHMKSSGPK